MSTTVFEKTDQRRLCVLVDKLAIEDGQIDPPEVGAVTSFPLLFTETAATAPDAVTVQGTLEPSPRPPMRLRDGWQWSGLLRGDGWTATWRGSRPLTGRVEMTGLFTGVMGIDASGWVRGRVMSVQIVSMFWKRMDTRARWAPVPDRLDYRPVELSPRFFSDDRMFNDDPPQPSRSEIGVLITLDLDDVPLLPLRPSLVAGDVSAGGTGVWALDQVLPKIIRLDNNGVGTMHLFPAGVASHRSIWATPTGCWISGPDGTYRVDATAETGRQISTVPVMVGAVQGEAFLACPASDPWLIHTPDGDPLEVTGIPEAVPIDAVADGDSFVALVRDPKASTSQSHQLIRIAMTGACQIGPPLPAAEDHSPFDPGLLDDPLTIVNEDTFIDITPELTVSTTRRIPRRFFRAGTLGDSIWTIGHPPQKSSRSWWPLEGPVTYDRSRGQFWLLTILDRATLQPVHTAPVLTSDPELTRDDHGTIWLAVAGELEKIVDLGNTMAWPEAVELTATDGD